MPAIAKRSGYTVHAPEVISTDGKSFSLEVKDDRSHATVDTIFIEANESPNSIILKNVQRLGVAAGRSGLDLLLLHLAQSSGKNEFEVHTVINEQLKKRLEQEYDAKKDPKYNDILGMNSNYISQRAAVLQKAISILEEKGWTVSSNVTGDSNTREPSAAT